jgi:hypothetical protein
LPWLDVRGTRQTIVGGGFGDERRPRDLYWVRMMTKPLCCAPPPLLPEPRRSNNPTSRHLEFDPAERRWMNGSQWPESWVMVVTSGRLLGCLRMALPMMHRGQ